MPDYVKFMLSGQQRIGKSKVGKAIARCEVSKVSDGVARISFLPEDETDKPVHIEAPTFFLVELAAQLLLEICPWEEMAQNGRFKRLVNLEIIKRIQSGTAR